MKRKIISCFALLGLFASCQSYYFDAEKPLEKDLWTYSNPITFEFKIEDTTVLYNLMLDVAHKNDYPTQNAYTRLQVRFPNGEEVKQQVSLEFANANGEWQGECSGNYCTRRLSFMPNAAFGQTGTYQVKFEQFTRKDSLEGIHSLRLMIEKTKLKKGAENQEKS